MSIQSCAVDKSRIARLIEYLLESAAFVSLVAENISPKFEIRSRADMCIRGWTYRTCMRDVIAADMIVTVHIYGTDSRAEESSSHPNKWTNPNTNANRSRHHDQVINISYSFDYDVASSGRWSRSPCRSISTCCEKMRTALSSTRCCIFAWRRVNQMLQPVKRSFFFYTVHTGIR